MKILPLVIVTMSSLLALQGQTLRDLTVTGSQDERLNVVFVAEGYTEGEESKFEGDAARLFNALIVDESWNRFQSWVNGYALFVASAESGTDDPVEGVTRDTYFNTSFNVGGIDRLLAIQFEQHQIYAVLRETMPAYDLAILVVNSTKYGGSGGNPITVSLNASAEEILLHELGHSFARLADEYIDDPSFAAATPELELANASQFSDRDQVEWTEFLFPEVPFPTPVSLATADLGEDLVGGFAGAYYRAHYYRPTANSKMRSLGRPFGPVNLKTFADTLHEYKLSDPSQPPIILKSPQPVTRDIGQAIFLEAKVTGEGPITFIWRRNGVYLPNSRSARFEIPKLTPTDFGTYVLEAENGRGVTRSFPVDITRVGEEVGPAISKHPISALIRGGQGNEITVIASGTGDLSYQWSRNGVAIGGATEPRFSEPGGAALEEGDYQVVVSNDYGEVTSRVALVAVPLPMSDGGTRLTNYSVRARLDTEHKEVVVGFVLEGEEPSSWLIRGIGPSLAHFGVNPTASNPYLKLRKVDGEIVAENDNWGMAENFKDLRRTSFQVGAFELDPASMDAALLVTLEPGVYTMEVGLMADSESGLGLIELYAVGDEGAQVINLSTRGVSGTGEDAIMCGFILAGDKEPQVLFRAVGPTLAQFGLSGTMANPSFRYLIRGRSTATNRDWWHSGHTRTVKYYLINGEIVAGYTFTLGEGEFPQILLPELTREFPRYQIRTIERANALVGAFPLMQDSLDAAKLIRLAPGIHRIVVNSEDDSSGIVLFELYLLPENE